ncbi:MAG: flagellar export protein FliJ [Stappiaceae bacterium]
MKSRDGLIRLRKFQVDEKRRQVAQIEMMQAEFHRMADDLAEQIKVEQDRVGITDVTHFAYPTFAKAAAQRRENLIISAQDLQGQLDKARDELTEALEELKKFELLEERNQERDRVQSDEMEQEALDEIAGRRQLGMQ